MEITEVHAPGRNAQGEVDDREGELYDRAADRFVPRQALLDGEPSVGQGHLRIIGRCSKAIRRTSRAGSSAQAERQLGDAQ
jgi:hypothetical protein